MDWIKSIGVGGRGVRSWARHKHISPVAVAEMSKQSSIVSFYYKLHYKAARRIRTIPK